MLPVWIVAWYLSSKPVILDEQKSIAHTLPGWSDQEGLAQYFKLQM